MSDASLFLLLLLAIAIGWALGRFGANKRHTAKTEHQPVNRQYIAGLNFLLNDQPDGAIEAFINSLEVNSETIETHLAIGKLSRRRGETDRAIRVHQNLLARPSLSREQRFAVQYELAVDYMKAGWLDRAERILVDLHQQAGGERQAVLVSLIELYQQEREWAQALPLSRELINTLPPQQALKHAVRAAHFCCEIGEEAISEKRFNDANRILSEAFELDSNCVRAAILRARAQLALGQNRRALKTLKKMAQQDELAVVQALPELQQVYDALGNRPALLAFLRQCQGERSNSALELAIYTEMQAQDGDAAALQFLQDRLAKRASMPALSELLKQQLAQLEGPASEIVASIQALVEQELQARPAYRCEHCGFSGKQMHWQCPGCQSWGTLAAVEF